MKLREATAQKPLLCFDLENRPLAYWYDGATTSEITAFGWKLSNERHVETMLLRADGTFDYGGDIVSDHDAYLIFRTVMLDAGLVYGHNIRRHDLPMLNAGLIRRELPTLRPVLTTDTCRDIPRRGGMSVSLENLAALYGLPGKKYVMPQPAWEKANRLGQEGMELARKRVVSDVVLQEKLRAKLRDLHLLKAPRMWVP